MQTLRAYLSTLPPAEQAAYAIRAGTTIGYLRKALSKGHRFDGALVRSMHIESSGAVSLTDLRPDIWPIGEPEIKGIEPARALIDSRMSKRALRERVGVQTDRHLAVVLGLPQAEVESWPDEGSVPAVPAVVKLLGLGEEQAPAPDNDDPDADRIAPIEVA